MLLHRFARSLKDQNWTAIAVEFLLLVLGVFLGIQVSNWNQSLSEQRLVRQKRSSYGCTGRLNPCAASRCSFPV